MCVCVYVLEFHFIHISSSGRNTVRNTLAENVNKILNKMCGNIRVFTGFLPSGFMSFLTTDILRSIASRYDRCHMVFWFVHIFLPLNAVNEMNYGV